MDNKYLIVCNTSQVALFSQQAKDSPQKKFITTEKDFWGLTLSNLDEFGRIVVIAELLWDGHTPDEFYGMDIAVSLRLRLKTLAPICILSFMPKVFFSNQTEIKYNILKARGTVFRQMPTEFNYIVNAFEGIIPLSQATLVYLSNLLVDVQHLIDLLRHVFRMTSSHNRIVDSLKKIDVLSSTVVYPNARDLANKIYKAHQHGNEEQFFKYSNELLDLLGTYWQQIGRTAALGENLHQTVVLVDDNLADLSWAKSALQDYFEVIPFQNALEAKTYIDNDPGNEIAAIISDWQLLKPGTDEHQEMLGFELLEYAARKGHYALFSLTSTDDFSTLEVDQNLWFEHTLITKDFHHEESLWKMYIPIIRQKIEHNRAIIASLPTGEGWTNNFKLAYRKENGKNVAYKQYYTSLKEQYILNRNSERWHSFETEVSCLSNNLWDYYKKALDPEERPFLFDLKTQWGIELNRDLKNVLVIRRLFLAFWFNKTQLDISFKIPDKGIIEDPVINVYSVLRNRYFNQILEERGGYDALRTYKDLNNAAKVFTSQLAIEPNQLPQGVLPEEKAWLINQGIKTDNGNDNLYYPD